MAKLKKLINVADQLRHLIDGCGLSRYEICKQTGIDKGALSRFMSGERSLTLDSVEPLAKLFDLRLTAHAKPLPSKKGG